MTARTPADWGRGDTRAQASTIGVVLVLAITLIGATVVVAIGSEAMEDTERATSVSKAEHSMTQFDSRVAMVGLGETSAQRVKLSDSAGGRYAATNDDGWMRVVHKNYSGTSNEEIYNESLGSVTYENEDTVVAYQGGGVWRQQGNGTTMLSPPEFHYRGATLTLPVIRVTNEDAASGSTDAFVTSVDDARRVYPNETATYGDGDGYDNPVLNGTVEVTVHSTYYRGWADYFDTRTTGNVTVDHANETATVELKTVSNVGEFTMADAISDGLDIRGQSEGHSVNDFEVRFQKDHGTMNNMYYSFYAEKGPHRYETVVHLPDGTKCNDGLDSSDELDVYTFYRNTTSGAQHEWSNTSVPADSGEIRLDCSGNGAVVVNFTAPVNQSYGDVSINDDGTYYDWSGTPNETAEFDHDGDDGERTVFDPVDENETSTRQLTRHYFALLGNEFTLNAQTGTGDRGGTQIDIDASGGTLDYNTADGGYYVTYLHITENEVRVELE